VTTTDAFQRDRVAGPKEAAYARYGTRLTWATTAVLVVALLVWIFVGTNDPPLRDGELLRALAWGGLLTVAGCCLLAARLVVGAMRAAAEAGGE